jgi:D-tagatose-1,6-bisphosphate aldolase subunit GatZ/KbaZ
MKHIYLLLFALAWFFTGCDASKPSSSPGGGKQLTVDLQYSLSDRVRYYWPDPVIKQARVKLFENLTHNPPPISLISQHLPHALHAVREGAATRDPLSLAVAHVSAVLDDYHHACYTH